MFRLLKPACWLATALALLLTASCNRGGTEVARALDFDAFVPQYNRYINDWVRAQREATLAEMALIDEALPAADGERREMLELQAQDLGNDLEKWDFRLSLGDYIKQATPADVPEGLVWRDGQDQPDIGDPAALKGGVFRQNFPSLSFPPTLRPFGENSNNSFRSNLYDDIDMPLVTLHPDTMEEMPGIAKEWAVSDDGRTVYMRLHPEARYSDGLPVTARDYLLSLYLRVSDNILNPYSKQYFREEFAQIASYGDGILSVSLAEPKAFAAATAGSLTPSHPEFYAEYGPDYTERYQWRFPPTTGAYEVLDGDVVKGTSITQTRVKDWWAKDMKYYRHRFNPDKIVTIVVRDESKAFELFRAGELDTFVITRPEFWYEKSEIPPVYDGYIERYTVFNNYPKIPRGFYFNVIKTPLDDRNVRIGIQYALHWQKVIDVMFRGDYQRLNAFNEGFPNFSDPTIRARPFSISAARAAFREAGYTEQGRDGILQKPDGTRLSVAVTYPAMPLTDRIMAILREDARACGFELRLDGLESTVSYRKTMQKQHELVFSGWNITPPFPDFYQFLHSSNAFDEKGNVRPQTNNIFSWARPDTDKLSVQVRTARSEDALAEAAMALQHIIHDEAIFAPAYSTDFMRIGSWRWIRWPDSEYTGFSPRYVYDPHEIHVLWVADEMKEETLAARRAGTTFPEVNRVFVPPPRVTADEAAPVEEAAPADESVAADGTEAAAAGDPAVESPAPGPAEEVENP
jgi:microcin C transport system substrate-binding protein